MAGAVSFLLTWGFDYLTKILFVTSERTQTPVGLWDVAFVPLWVYLGWRKSGFKRFCTFAGDCGCTHFQCERQRTSVIRKSSVRFAHGSAVSAQTVLRTKNGVYHGTNSHFHLYSSNPEKVIYSTTGGHMADSKTPPPENFFNFACAVESAWYRYAVPKIDAEFAQKGAVKFYLGDKNSCVLGLATSIWWTSTPRGAGVARTRFRSARLFDGRLTIRRKAPRRSFFDLFNSEGVFGFPYGAIHNPRLFLYLFERSLGLKKVQ
jgi:hypothetical protein